MNTKPEDRRPANPKAGKDERKSGGGLDPTQSARKQHRPRDTEETLDEALEESFPASDPPSRSQPAIHVGTKKDHERKRTKPPSARARPAPGLAAGADRKLDEALALTFPASDPPAQTQSIVHVGVEHVRRGKPAPYPR